MFTFHVIYNAIYNQTFQQIWCFLNEKTIFFRKMRCKCIYAVFISLSIEQALHYLKDIKQWHTSNELIIKSY